MEKEKQKAVERERQEILRKQELEARKQAEDEARAVLNPCKSKFVGVQMHALIACFANKAMLNDPGKHSFFISFLVTFLKCRILIPRRKLNKMLMMGYIISRWLKKISNVPRTFFFAHGNHDFETRIHQIHILTRIEVQPRLTRPYLRRNGREKRYCRMWWILSRSNLIVNPRFYHITKICFGIDVKGAEIVDRNPSGGNERRNRCYMQRGLEPRTCQRYPRYTRYN